MWVKKLRRKALAQDVFDRSWRLDGLKTLIKKYQCEIFNFVDLCSGVGIVWSTTTRTRVSLYLVSGNMFSKWFASYLLFIHEHLIIMWSPTVNISGCFFLNTVYVPCKTFQHIGFALWFAVNKLRASRTPNSVKKFVCLKYWLNDVEWLNWTVTVKWWI